MPSRLALLCLALAIGVGACERSPQDERDEPDAGEERAAPPPEPQRTAAGATDLRRMAAEVTAARICDPFRDAFRAIGGDRGAITGVAWFEHCEASAAGTTLTLRLRGRGWRYVSHETQTAGAKFAVDTYVRFSFSIETRGELDVAYAADKKILTLWFTPAARPQTTFEPIGGIEVDKESAWSSVVGGLGSLVSSSPESRAHEKVTKQGTQGFSNTFAQGVAITVDLCTGELRGSLGHPPAGEMIGPPQAVHDVTAELHARGLLLDGPKQQPPGGPRAETGGERVTSEMICVDDAKRLARAFLAKEPLPAVSPAGANASCKRVHMLRAGDGLAGTATVRYQVSETAMKTRPLANCR